MVDGDGVSIEKLNDLVEQHMAFLIRTVSDLTGRYISVEHDDEFSIALSAFAEAVERYQPERGAFLPFARLVVRSRVQTYLKQKNRHREEISLEALEEAGEHIAAPENESHDDLQDEIHLFQQELSAFGLSLDVLADESPRHQDTRTRAIEIAHRSSQEPQIVRKTYQKKKLPVRAVAKLCAVSEKIVKGSRHFILATMLVFVKPFPILIRWIEGARCIHVR